MKKKELCKNLVSATLFILLAQMNYGCDQVVKLEIANKPNTLYFDKKELEVKAGSRVNLIFRNNDPVDAGMRHVFLLLEPGSEAEVVAASLKAGEAAGYVPAISKVLAHSRLIGPGESDEINFRAPEVKGDYPYICAFPGHFSLMKGILHVK